MIKAAAAAGSASMEIPARPLPELARDASEAVAELGRMAADHRVIVFCQNQGELSRLHELKAEFAPDAEDQPTFEFTLGGMLGEPIC